MIWVPRRFRSVNGYMFTADANTHIFMAPRYRPSKELSKFEFQLLKGPNRKVIQTAEYWLDRTTRTDNNEQEIKQLAAQWMLQKAIEYLRDMENRYKTMADNIERVATQSE